MIAETGKGLGGDGHSLLTFLETRVKALEWFLLPTRGTKRTMIGGAFVG